MPEKFLQATVIEDFRGGKVTKFEADLISASSATELINVNMSGQIGLRPRSGTAIHGTFSSTSNPVNSGATFIRKDGLERPVISSGTILEAFNPFLATPDYNTLDTGFTDAKIFGFADGDAFLYMGNAIEAIRKWTGAVARFDKGNTTATVIALKTETEDGVTLDTAALLGFSSSGTVFINGTAYTYGGLSGLTLTSAQDATGETDLVSVIEKPITSGFTSAPKGNIFLIKDSRLLIAGDPTDPNNLYGSKIGDVTNFSFSSPAVADDGFTLKIYGPPITSLIDKGEYVAIGAENGVEGLSYVQLTSSTDTILTVPRVRRIFKGQGQGPINNKGAISFDYDGVFSSRQLGLRRLSRADGDLVDKPESLTEAIEPDYAVFDQTDVALGHFLHQFYQALRSTTSVPGNDTIVLKDRRDGWISILKGLNASCWFIYKNKLYYGDSFTKNVYQTNTDDFSDFDGTNFFPYLVDWQSKFFDYNVPFNKKEVRRVLISGFITPNTTVDFSIITDGVAGLQSITKQIVGTADYVQAIPSIAFGRNVFGIKGFASADGTPTGLKPFRRVITTNDLPKDKWFRMKFRVQTNNEGYRFIITRIQPQIAVLPIVKTNRDTILNS